MKFSKGMSENLSPSPCSDVSGVWGLMSSPRLWLCPPLQLRWRMSLLPWENACQSLLQPSPIFPLPMTFLHINNFSLCQNYNWSPDSFCEMYWDETSPLQHAHSSPKAKDGGCCIPWAGQVHASSFFYVPFLYFTKKGYLQYLVMLLLSV